MQEKEVHPVLESTIASYAWVIYECSCLKLIAINLQNWVYGMLTSSEYDRKMAHCDIYLMVVYSLLITLQIMGYVFLVSYFT